MWRRIRVREVLVVGTLTVVVTTVASAFHVAHLTGIQLEAAERHARSLAQQVAGVAAAAAEDAGAEALADDAGVRALLEAQLASEPHLVHAAVSGPEGRILVASPSASAPGTVTDFAELAGEGTLRRFLLLRRRGTLLGTRVGLERGGEPLAAVRLVTDTRLIRDSLDAALAGSAKLALAALVLAFGAALLVAHLAHRPIRAIARQIERLRHGELDLDALRASGVDLGELSSQLAMLGEEMRSERLRLLARNATLEHVLDHLQDGVLLVDADERILFFNRAFRQVLGRPLDEVVGDELDDHLEPTHPLRRILRYVATEGTDVERLQCTLPAEERFRDVLVSAVRIPGDEDDAAPRGVVVLVDDLGSLRTLQSLVAYGARALAMSRMTRGVVHEVKNPLNAMTLHLELLREHLDAGDLAAARGHVGPLNDVVRTLDGVVQGFLDYVRPRELELREVDLVALLRGLAEFVRPDAARRGVAVELELPDEPVVVRAEERVLRQVFLNLVQNALEALGRSGTVRVGIRGDGTACESFVEDDGPGIASEDLERVFDLYWTSKDRGNGIGLPMARRLVEEHGGRLELASTLGEGTRVTVCLPRVAPASLPAGPRDRSEPGR